MQLIQLWESDLVKAYECFSSFEEDENGFMNDAYGLNFEEFRTFVEKRKDASEGIGLKPNHVPDTVYMLEDEGNYVGIFKFRHYLTEGLKQGAGHIGYGIAKAYRGKGYATKGLKCMIEIAKTMIPESEIYMSVHKDNPASLRVQINNGAVIHHEDDTEYYTRIKI